MNLTVTAWDTARAWGKSPVLASPAAAGDTEISVSGLGTGTLPAYVSFFIAGVRYQLTQPATISGGAALLTIDPPMDAAALAAVAITDTNTLATDADLTQQDSAAIGLAKKIVDSTSQKSAYDGKRALAKRDIAAWLWRRGFQTDGIVDPWQFNRAATLLELAYIYQDLSRRNEGIANEKAAMYRTMHEAEIEGLRFDYQTPVTPATNARVQSTAVFWRS